MDAIENAATEFGVTAPRRFFGGSPFQSLQSRYELETSRMATLRASMAEQAEAVDLANRRLSLERNQVEATEVDRKLAEDKSDEEDAFAILGSFRDRKHDDPSIIADLQRAIYTNPRLIKVPAFKDVFDGIVSLNSDGARLDRQIAATKMTGQQRYLRDEAKRVAGEITSLEATLGAADPKTGKLSTADEETTKKIADLRAKQENLNQLQLKVTERPLSDGELTGNSTKQTAFQKAASKFQ